MVLVIDIGNTKIKAAVFEGFTAVSQYDFLKNEALLYVKKIIEQHKKIKFSVTSSVAKINSDVVNFLKNKTSFIEINHDILFPFKNNYATPQTLGIDKMVLMAGAALLYPNKNVLVIDCGTCITYDLLTETNEYFGGAISPGLRTRYKSLHTFTDKLPLLDNEIPNNYIGNSTNQSIHSGVVNGLLFEIEGFISQYSLNFSDLTIILTGGDANFLAKSIKSTIFAHSNFLLESLNVLFNYLKNKNE